MKFPATVLCGCSNINTLIIAWGSTSNANICGRFRCRKKVEKHGPSSWLFDFVTTSVLIHPWNAPFVHFPEMRGCTYSHWFIADYFHSFLAPKGTWFSRCKPTVNVFVISVKDVPTRNGATRLRWKWVDIKMCYAHERVVCFFLRNCAKLNTLFNRPELNKKTVLLQIPSYSH